MARFNKSTINGRVVYDKEVKLLSGERVRLSGSYEEILQQIQDYVKKGKLSHIGRPLGTKNYAGRPFNEKDLKRMFNSFYLAVSGSAIATHVGTLDEIGRELLKRAYQQRGGGPKGRYNTYTGNLDRSYIVSIISGRKRIGLYENTEAESGSEVIEGPKGGLYAAIKSRKHDPGVFVFKSRKRKIKYEVGKHMHGPKSQDMDKQIVRYLRRKYERRNGYAGKGIGRKSSSFKGFGYVQGLGDNRIQSGIILENLAPYAGSVQAAGYSVLQNATMRSFNGIANKQKQLYRVVSKRTLQAAGFKVI